MRCRSCLWYNYNFLDAKYEEGSFCGLHGGREVDPDGPQVQMLRSEGKPDCHFVSKYRQLSLF